MLFRSVTPSRERRALGRNESAFTDEGTWPSYASSMGRSVSRQRVIVRQSYYWPDQQLNFWIIIMLATGGVLIGVFANFIVVQTTLGGLGIPW